jgi:hypothetical protein
LGDTLAGEPLAYHRYAYAGNNPVSLADPYGNNPLIGMAIGAILGGLSAGVQSNWNFNAILRGATVGGITGSIGGIGGPWAAAAAGATGAAIGNGNIVQGASLGLLGWGFSSALSEGLGDVAGGTVASAGLAAINGDDVGQAAAMSLAGSAMESTFYSAPEENPLQADISGGSGGGGPSPGLMTKGDKARLAQIDPTFVDLPIQPSWSPFDLIVVGPAIRVAETAWTLARFFVRVGQSNDNWLAVRWGLKSLLCE